MPPITTTPKQYEHAANDLISVFDGRKLDLFKSLTLPKSLMEPEIGLARPRRGGRQNGLNFNVESFNPWSFKFHHPTNFRLSGQPLHQNSSMDINVSGL